MNGKSSTQKRPQLKGNTMKIIANIEGGFLIEATENEVKEILRSVHGKPPEEIGIGQKIPVVDYAETISKLKSLPVSYSYNQLIESATRMANVIKGFQDAAESVSEKG